MNTNQLKYFVSVAECRSFTVAADRNYLSQAAITQQIRSLEEYVGVPLIDRGSRPVTLTPAGTVFLNEAKAILERLDAAVAKTQDMVEGMTGSLRIGYMKGYEYSDLPGKMRRFHRKYPNMLVTCYRGDTDTLASGLIKGDYDLIFTWDSTNIRQNTQVEMRTVMQSRFLVALYGSHPFAQRASLSRADLKDDDILFMTPSATGDSYGDAYYIGLYQKAGYNPKILLNTSDIESTLMMVAAEEGISILPSYCTNELPNIDNIVFLPLEGEDEVEEIVAVWRKDDTNPALKDFLG